MKLITLTYVTPGNLSYIPSGGRTGVILESWLYSGGTKRFLSLINKSLKEKKLQEVMLKPVILNVEELGKLSSNEIQDMIADGYNYMPLDLDNDLYIR